MSTALRLLILEDDPIDAELEIATLEETGYACQWKRVETRAEFLACLDAPDYDLILVDYNLPTFDGLTALRLYLERDLDLPFIFVSGTMGEETAIESLKAGATDYVLKERLSRLGPVVERALHEREEHRRLRKAEEELQKNQQLLTAIVDHSPVAIQVKDLDGHYLLVNSQIETLFDMQRGEAIDKTPSDIFPHEIAKKFLIDDQDALKAKTAVQTEEVIPLPDGIHTFVVLKFPLMDAAGEPYAVAGISTDITEQKRTEEALQDSRRRLRAIFDQTFQFMGMMRPDGILTEANQTALDFAGLEESDVIGKPFWETPWWAHSSELQEQLRDAIRRAASGEFSRFEVNHLSADGSLHDIDFSLKPVKDEAGNVSFLIPEGRDITKRVRTEKALRIQRDLGVALSSSSDLPEALNLVLKAALQMEEIDSGGVYLLDALTGKLDLAAYTGMSAEFIDSASHYAADASHAQIVLNGKPTYMHSTDFASDMREPMQREGLRATAIIPVIYEKQVIASLNLASHAHDEITASTRNALETIGTQIAGVIARIEAVRALQTSEERYRIISELTSDITYAVHVEPDGTTVPEWTAGALARITGFDADGLMAHGDWSSILHPGDLPLAVKHLQIHLTDQSDVAEYRIITKDGETRWLRDYRYPIWDKAQDRVVRIIGAAQDITERKRAEEALRKQQDLVSHIMETSPAGIIVVNSDGQITFANARAEQVLGLKENEITQRSYNDPKWRITDYDGNPFPSNQLPFAQVMSTGQPVYAVRHTIDWPNGRQVLLSINAAPLLNENGQVDGMVSTVEDVTQQVQAEQALRESEQRFRNIVESTPLGMHMYSLETDGQLVFTGTNPAADHILGVDNNQFVGKTIEEAFPALAETEVPEAYRRVAAEGQIWQTDQITYEEGQITGAFEVRAFQTSPGKMAAAFLDITDRKRAEEALRESEEKHRLLFETMAQGVVYQAAAGQITSANPAAEQVLGLTLDQMQGRTSTDPRWKTIHEDGSDFLGETHPAMVALKSGERVHNVTMGVFNPLHDEYRWINVNAVPQFKPGESTPYQVYTTFEDITERKRAAEALATSEATLRSIFRVAPVGIGLVKDRVFQWTNDTLHQMLGYTAEELEGQSSRMIYPSHEEYERVGKMKYDGIKERGTGSLETRFQRKDGQIIDILLSSTPLDPKDLSKGVTFTALDITERKRAEEAVKKSQESLARAQSIAHLGGWEWNMVAQKTTWSDENYRISGYAPSDVEPTFEKFLETVHPDDRDTILQRLGDIQEGKITRDTYEYRIILPDGAERWLEGQLDVLFDKGQPITLVGTNLDITERKLAEEERERLLNQVQEQAQRVQQIIETVPEGVILLDNKNHVILANPLGHKDLAALADTLVGGTLTRLGERPLAEFLTSPPYGLWHEVSTEEQTFQVIARPIETGPTPGGWVLVVHDITQQREIERRIHQQERLAAVGQLAAGIAHDFNNIMAVISLYAGMSLRTADLPEKIYERLETIDQQAHRASDLIQQILDFSRRAVLERLPMELGMFLKEQVKLLRRTLPENIKIDLSMGSDEYTVNADLTRVQQMIMNLATNARDSMPEGGQLQISLEKIWVASPQDAPVPDMGPGEWVCITMADTGCGIPANVLPHIYDPFFTTKPVGMGTGLGLSQVYGIVKQHEGHIEVATQEGEGTTFTIYLPSLSRRQPKPILYKTEALVQGQGQLIMVVEDDSATRAALVDSLELLNYRVIEAINGREALSIFKQLAGQADASEQIALVLSDMVMPEMGGKALLYALREISPTAKVVLLTGHPLDEGTLEDLKPQDLHNWLLKPLSIEQLSQVVAQALGEK